MLLKLKTVVMLLDLKTDTILLELKTVVILSPEIVLDSEYYNYD